MTDDDETGSIMRAQFDVFAQSLPTCVNRDLIDKVSFCQNNLKPEDIKLFSCSSQLGMKLSSSYKIFIFQHFSF